MPAGASRIQVSYGFSEPVTAAFGNGPGNVVDIGIFDSRGYDFLDPSGFRGWSGSSKPQFFLARGEATPGYIRGPLFPGEWNVMLGVDRIEPEGVRYEVTVTVEEEQRAASDPARPEASKERAEYAAPHTRQLEPGTRHSGRWLKGDLHCHTVHSDGLNSVEEIVRNAVDLGLDFLAVTDHNTNTHHEELDRLSHLPIVLIPGEEVTTYWGHANMWGLREWIDFRCADEDSIQAVRKYVLRKGGPISLNHPKSVGPPWLFRGWEGYPAMEVWQAPWRFHNWESLERWDALLRKGERVVAVGGSDVHSIPPAEPRHPHGLANPTTWVWAGDWKTENGNGKTGETGNEKWEMGNEEEAVLDAIRAGHVFITDAPNETRLVLRADADGDGRFEALMGDTVSPSYGRPLRFRVEARGNPDWRLWLIADGVPVEIRPLDKVESVHEFSLDVFGAAPRACGAAGASRPAGARGGGVGDDEPGLGLAGLVTPKAETGRIRRFGLKSIELVAGEEFVADVTAWHLHRRRFWQGNGMLFLTNQRVIFRPIRITISHGHEWKLEKIKAIGRAKLSPWSRIGGFLTAWYVDVEGERHYFAPWLIFHRGWLEKLEKTSGLAIGEPRALFS